MKLAIGKQLGILLMGLIVAVISALLINDFTRLERFQQTAQEVKIGMDQREITQIAGPPDATGNGRFGSYVSGQALTDTIWTYRTMFDWFGDRAVGDHDPRPYWWTRVSPTRDLNDEVLEVWFRDGKVIGVRDRTQLPISMRLRNRHEL